MSSPVAYLTKSLRAYPRLVADALPFVEALEKLDMLTRDDLINAILGDKYLGTEWRSYEKSKIGTSLNRLLMALDVIDARYLPEIVFRPIAVRAAQVAQMAPEIAFEKAIAPYKPRPSLEKDTTSTLPPPAP